jgi:CheY-like chemotaxis protein
MMAQQLRGKGAEVVTAGGQEEALRELREGVRSGRRISAAVVDLALSDGDGMSLANDISADPALEGLPIVLLTRFGQTASVIKERPGIAAVLSKPVRENSLAASLASILRSGGKPSIGAAEEGPDEGEEKHLYSLRVLVAEDNVVNQKVALRMLQKLGCRADVAANGLEAVGAMDRVPYDLVLMDCQMPELDGYAATRAIRKKEKGGHRVVIVAMTANALEGDRERCLEAGMDDYLPKPVNSKTLERILRAWVPKSRHEQSEKTHG